MRFLPLIALAIAGVTLATPAEAQRVWRDGQWVTRGGERASTLPPARAVDRARINPPQGAPQGGARWGAKIGGRWEGGMRAPGGWGAYRRPVRGWVLPSYWIGGSFWISDWTNWGLSRPPAGYNWVRYYDDAVLVDRSGKIWDSVSGIDWDRGDAYAYAGEGYAYAEARGGGGGYAGRGADYDAPGYEYDERYRPEPIPAQPYPGGYAPPPQTYAAPAAQSPCAAPCGGGYRAGGGYAQGGYAAQGGYGYYYGGPTTTTIVIQSAPVVTTTVTEEIIEERVVYSAPRTVRRAPTKAVRRAPVKSKTCYCR